MAFYESIFIVRQDSQEVENLTKQFSQIVTENGGKIVKKEYWGLRTLAYPVKKNRKGHYVMLCLDAEPAALKELERNLGLHEDILRNVSVRVEAFEEGPSFMMNTRGDYQESRRDDRDAA